MFWVSFQSAALMGTLLGPASISCCKETGVGQLEAPSVMDTDLEQESGKLFRGHDTRGRAEAMAWGSPLLYHRAGV